MSDARSRMKSGPPPKAGDARSRMKRIPVVTDDDAGFVDGIKGALDEQAAAVEPIVTGAGGAVAIGKDDDVAGRMAELGAATQQDADRGDFGTAARRVLGTAAPFIAPGLGIVGAAMNKAEDYLADDAAPGVEAEAAQGQRDKTAKNFADNPRRAVVGGIGGGLLTLGAGTAAPVEQGAARLVGSGSSVASQLIGKKAIEKIAPSALKRAIAAVPIGVAGSLNTSEGLDSETTAGRAALMGLLSAAGGAGFAPVADDVAMLASGARNVAGDVGDAAVRGAQGMRTAHPTPGASMVPDAVKKLARTGAAGLTGGKSEVALKVRDLLRSIAGKEAETAPRGSSPSTLAAVKSYAAKAEPPPGPYSTRAPAWEPPTASSSGDDFVFNSPDDVAAANQSMASRVKGLGPEDLVEPSPAVQPVEAPPVPDLAGPEDVAAAAAKVDDGLPEWMRTSTAQDWGTKPRADGLGFDGAPLPVEQSRPPDPDLVSYFLARGADRETALAQAAAVEAGPAGGAVGRQRAAAPFSGVPQAKKASPTGRQRASAPFKK